MADDQTDADGGQDLTETLFEKGGAKPGYVNVSASFDVAVPDLKGGDEDQERFVAKKLAKARFNEEFGFTPGLRSEVSAEHTGRGMPGGYSDIEHNAKINEYRVVVIAQEHGV